MTKDQLSTLIRSTIYENDNNEIQADKHQYMLLTIISSIYNELHNVGTGFLGKVSPTNPAPTPATSGFYMFDSDGTVSYLANKQVKAGGYLTVEKAVSTYNYGYVEPYADLTDDIDNGSSTIGASAKAVLNLKEYLITLITKQDDANTVKAKFDNIGNVINTFYLKVGDVKNNFTSTDTNKPLSALKGKELYDYVVSLQSKLDASNVNTIINKPNGIAGLDASGKLTEALLPYPYQKTSEKGQPNGYASLDGSGDVPDAQIPANIERNTNKNAANGYAGLGADIKVLPQLLPDEPSYIEFERTGDGTGVASVGLNCYTSNTATITGGTFYSDATGTTSLGSSVQLFAGIDKVLYWKATDRVGMISMINLDKLKSLSQPTNAPKLIGSISSINTKSEVSSIGGTNEVSGNLVDLDRNLKVLSIGGNSAIMGDVADAPRAMNNIFNVSGSYVSIYGLFKNLPKNITYCLIYGGGQNKVGGDIADIPSSVRGINIAKIVSGGTPYSYTPGHVFPSSFDYLIVRPYATGEITPTMTDAILHDLRLSVTTAVSSKTIDLRGNCGARTSASDADVAALVALGFQVLTN